MKLIVGNGMKHILPRPPGIVSMNHLAHQPEILFFCIHNPAQIAHKIKFQTVRTIQPDTVNIKSVNPETHHVKEILAHSFVIEIQVGQFKTISPGLVIESIVIMSIPLKAYILIPPAIPGLLSLFLQILECEKFPARVVKYAVHYHTDSILMAEIHKMPEVLIISKPAVYQPVISGIIAVAGRFKQRADINGSHSILLHMRDPGIQILEAVNCLLFRIIFRRPR